MKLLNVAKPGNSKFKLYIESDEIRLICMLSIYVQKVFFEVKELVALL